MGATAALAAAPETRPVTDAELKAFHAYYQQQFPDNHSGTPVFSIRRDSAAAPWQIAATADAPATRGLRTLCRLNRINFAYDKGWSAAKEPVQLVWMESAGCHLPAQPVTLLQRLPDSEVLAMLEQQQKLLTSARLLMSGNSACASQRSHPYTLAAILVGLGGTGMEEMMGLDFRSYGAKRATVWVRRNGLGYDAWNVNCGPSAPGA